MNKNKIIQWLKYSLVAIVALYSAVIVYFVMAEDSFVFHPNYTSRKVAPPADSLNLDYKPVTITTKDQETLYGWEAFAQDSSGKWILFLHGNAGNVSDLGHPQRIREFVAHGYNVLLVDYRGYGLSTGTPSEEGLYTDAEAIYDYLSITRQIPASNIIVYGWSLGSGVASNLCTKVNPEALVLEGAYTSVAEVGQRYYPFIPATKIGKNQFNTLSRIDKIQCRLLLIHATDDAQIPFDMSETLFQKAKEPKLIVKVKGGHMNAFSENTDLIFKTLDMFIQKQ